MTRLPNKVKTFICLMEGEMLPCVWTSAQSTCGNYCGKNQITVIAVANYGLIDSYLILPYMPYFIANQGTHKRLGFKEIPPDSRGIDLHWAGSPTVLHRLCFLCNYIRRV